MHCYRVLQLFFTKSLAYFQEIGIRNIGTKQKKWAKSKKKCIQFTIPGLSKLFHLMATYIQIIKFLNNVHNLGYNIITDFAFTFLILDQYILRSILNIT